MIKMVDIETLFGLIYEKLKLSPETKETRKGYMVRCPSGSHNDSHPSCMIYHDGWVKCYACGFSMSINKLAEQVGLSERVSYKKPEPKPYVYRELKLFATDFIHQPYNFNYLLKGYIQARGIPREFVEFTEMFEWRNGYSRYEDNLTPYETFDRLAIPLFDNEGRLIGHELRKYKNFEDQWPKVLYQSDCPNKRFLYNQHNLDFMMPIYISEGIMDLTNLFNVVGPTRIGATYGSNLSEHQLNILNKIPNLIICLDRDKAGLDMIEKIAQIRVNFKILIPHNKDLGADTSEMVDDDIKNRTISYTKFISEVDMDWFLDPSYDQMYDDIHYTTDFE